MRLSKANRVSYQELTTQSTPPATATWQPMPHHKVMTTVVEEVRNQGLNIDEIKYEIVPVKDSKYPDMFTTMYMESDNGTFRNMLGIRNSHNKRFGAAACSGSSVMVCSNGCFSGDHQISAKHTPNVEINFVQRVQNMIQEVKQSWVYNEQRYNGYKDRELSSRDFHEILGEAVVSNAILPSKARKVYEEYINPRHDDFKDRNAWSAFNAFTEIHKESPLQPHQAATRGIQLHGVFDRFCAENIEAQVNQPEELTTLLALN